MIILRSPKGWTGPKYVDGLKTEGYWRSHQVPFGDMEKPEHVKLLEEWMRSYRPQELFDDEGRLRPEIAALAPEGDRRMSANPHTNGGLLRRDPVMPDFSDYAVGVAHPGRIDAESTRIMGAFLRDVMRLNLASNNFRLFGPDETESNRLGDVYDRIQEIVQLESPAFVMNERPILLGASSAVRGFTADPRQYLHFQNVWLQK